MTRLQLLKLLYLIDREALGRWEWPVTFDTYVSMDHGPVLSQTYDLIKGSQGEEYWHRFVKTEGNLDVVLIETPPDGELSQAEIELANEMFNLYGQMTGGALVDLTHELCEEWEAPEGSSKPILIADILSALKVDSENQQEILQEMAAVAWDERTLKSQ